MRTAARPEPARPASARTVGCPRCGRPGRIVRQERAFSFDCRCHYKPGPEDLVRLWLGAGN